MQIRKATSCLAVRFSLHRLSLSNNLSTGCGVLGATSLLPSEVTMRSPLESLSVRFFGVDNITEDCDS